MNRENQKVFKAVIIGGGMSGLVSAITLSRRFGGQNIALIERLNRVGKKILSTGNGQCNITNSDLDISHFHSSNKNIIFPILCDYNEKNLISFFEDLGVLITCDGGKYYPNSRQASSILDALRFEVDNLKTKLFLEKKAIKINRENHFKVFLDDGNFLFSENVIVATGGKSSKHLGSDGSAFDFLCDLGYKITPLYPSIVQLKTDLKKIKGMKGLKQYANVLAKVDGKVVESFLGEVLFADYGVSGNAIFYLSSYLVANKNSSIVIDFCPNLETEYLYNFLLKKIENCSYITYENLFNGIMNNKIANACLKNSGAFDLTNLVDKNTLAKVIKIVKNYEIAVLGSLGFDNSQVTKGGLNLNQFTCDLESKLHKGLYAVGEVLDVDGDCGGYNLQWAYSSAQKVASVIK